MSGGSEGGGALENFDMQGRIGQLLQQFGADTQIQQTKTKEYTPAHQNDTQGTSDNESESTSTLVEGDRPNIPPPNSRKMTEDGNNGFGTGTETSQTNLIPSFNIEGNGDATPEMAQLVDYAQGEPAVQALYQLVGSDKTSLDLINQFFTKQGIEVPVSADNPKLSEAVQSALTTYFTETNVFMPEEKAEMVMSGVNTSTNIKNYFTSLTTIDPAEKAVDPAAATKTLQTAAKSAGELVDQIITQLKQNSLTSKEDQMALLEYLKFISQLISELRQTLASMDFADSSRGKELSLALQNKIDQKRQNIAEKFQELWKQLKLKKQMDYVQNFMKISNYTMSGVGIGVAILLLPLNPVMGLILLAIMISQFVVITSLQETGKMDDIFDKLNEWWESAGTKIFSVFGADEGLAKGLGKVAIWSIMLAFLTVAALAGAVTPFLGTMVVAAVMPAIMLILSESKMVDVIMGALQDVTGLSDKWRAILTGVVSMIFSLAISFAVEVGSVFREIAETIIKFIVSAVVEIIAFVIKAIITALTAGGGAVAAVIAYIAKILAAIVGIFMKVFNVIKVVLVKIAKMLQFFMEKLQSTTKIAENIKNAIMQLLKQVERFLASILRQVDKIIEKLEKAESKLDDLFEDLTTDNPVMKAIQDMIKNNKILRSIKDIKRVFDKVKVVIKKIRGMIQDLLLEVTKTLHTTSEAGKEATNAAVSAGLGAVQLKMAKITEEEGDIEYLIKLLNAIIKLLNDMIAKLTGEISSSSGSSGEVTEQIKSLQKLFEQLIANMSNISTEIAASAIT